MGNDRSRPPDANEATTSMPSGHHPHANITAHSPKTPVVVRWFTSPGRWCSLAPTEGCGRRSNAQSTAFRVPEARLRAQCCLQFLLNNRHSTSATNVVHALAPGVKAKMIWVLYAQNHCLCTSVIHIKSQQEGAGQRISCGNEQHPLHLVQAHGKISSESSGSCEGATRSPQDPFTYR